MQCKNILTARNLSCMRSKALDVLEAKYSSKGQKISTPCKQHEQAQPNPCAPSDMQKASAIVDGVIASALKGKGNFMSKLENKSAALDFGGSASNWEADRKGSRKRRSSQCDSVISRKKSKTFGVGSPSMDHKYETFIKLHELWKQYISDVLSTVL